jgi:hypothetical protein
LEGGQSSEKEHGCRPTCFFALIGVTSPLFGQTLKTSMPAGDPIKIGGSLPLTFNFTVQTKGGEESDYMAQRGSHWQPGLPQTGVGQIVKDVSE